VIGVNFHRLRNNSKNTGAIELRFSCGHSRDSWLARVKSSLRGFCGSIGGIDHRVRKKCVAAAGILGILFNNVEQCALSLNFLSYCVNLPVKSQYSPIRCISDFNC